MDYQKFTATGVINTTVLDAGLYSTVEEPKRIDAVLLNISSHIGNTIEGWIGNERVLEVPDYIANTNALGAATLAFASTTKIVRLPIEKDIPPGQIFKIGVKSGAVANNLDGAYEYTGIK